MSNRTVEERLASLEAENAALRETVCDLTNELSEQISDSMFDDDKASDSSAKLVKGTFAKLARGLGCERKDGYGFWGHTSWWEPVEVDKPCQCVYSASSTCEEEVYE